MNCRKWPVNVRKYIVACITAFVSRQAKSPLFVSNKKGEKFLSLLSLCKSLTDYRTFREDF